MELKHRVKITVAKSAGFCFGVKRAINIATEASHKKQPIYMLGDIVHNEDVVRLIEQAGIKKVRKTSRSSPGHLLVRAHGSSKNILIMAKRNGFKVIDATCPMVKEIHKIVIDMDRKGYKIIVIGDHKHDEVQGIIGQIKNKAIVLEDAGCIKNKISKMLNKAAVVVQSTQNLDKVLKMQKTLKERIRDLRFYNTICAPTRLKQTEIKSLPRKNDCMIIIGSKSSANTKRLYEISRALNKKSHWVNSPYDIRQEWFRGVKSVGIAAGASTPNSTINAIKFRIQKITFPQTPLTATDA